VIESDRLDKNFGLVFKGTSGDTGSAAIHSVRGLSWVDIIVLYPKNRCSKFQQLQMTTVLDENVHLFAGEEKQWYFKIVNDSKLWLPVDGSSDDLDIPIKTVLTDTDFSNQFNLCSVNSINWGRVVAQTVHFIYCYFRTIETLDERNFSRQVEIAVPTGACGNLTGGII
jgi:threonine synthase